MVKRGGVAEKRVVMTLKEYKETGLNFWYQRQGDLSSANREVAGDYLISYDGQLHMIEVKQVSLYLDRDRISFKEFEKRGQLDRIIKFQELGKNHHSWHLVIFWMQSLRHSPSFLIPSKELKEAMHNHDKVSFNLEDMKSLFYFHRLDIWNNKYLYLTKIFKREVEGHEY